MKLNFDFVITFNPGTSLFEAVGRPKNGDRRLIVVRKGEDIPTVKDAIRQAAKDAMIAQVQGAEWSEEIDTEEVVETVTEPEPEV